MKFFASTGFASATLALAILSAPAAGAADLGGGWARGSIKDDVPSYVSAPVGPCYFRGDVGYSMSGKPDVSWPQTLGGVLVTSRTSRESMDDGMVAEAGVGCGSGSRGLRAEFMLGYRGDRDVSTTTGPWTAAAVNSTARLSSKLTTYTAMVNVYADLGHWRGMVPYLGVGVGTAYHQMGDVAITGHPGATGGINGDSDMTFAWALMAGAGYQVSDRAILDFGYRYIDLGKASSSATSTNGINVQPRMVVNDLAAHEFKIGLRYHFGGASSGGYVPPMK